MNYISLKEFRDEGYLQEVNRRFLHCVGLALVVSLDGDDVTTLRIRDCRDDPEGMVFTDLSTDEARAKYNNVAALLRKKTFMRRELFHGSPIQPIGNRFNA